MTAFSDLHLDPLVLKAVNDAGYTEPTPIQADAIPHALMGKDVLGIAQTGTGKTASFVLPMITMLQKGRAKARMPRTLVLCPTRELAAQVAENFDTYAKYTKLTKALLIGGVSFKEQDLLIDRGVDVLIATPGRLLDHQERGKLLLTGVQIMVVDEADRMLDMGFIPDIERIFKLTPFTRQTLFFSATMAPEIERITNEFLHSPARVEVARQATASETIEQGVVLFRPSRKTHEASEKRALLRAMIDAEGEACTNAIIFCNRKTEVDALAKALKKYGYNAEPIHGDLDQSQRTRTLDGFRNGTIKFLIASDVAARGLDIPAVSHIFNYDVPTHSEDYVHRIGRTGRAGRQGKALMISGARDEKNLDGIERLLQKHIPPVAPPEGHVHAVAPEPEPETEAPRKPRGRVSAKGRGEAKEPQPARASREPKAPRTATPNPAAEPVAEAAEPAPKPEPAARPEPAAKRAPAAEKRPARERRERGRASGRDDGVVGMGEDVPSFIAKSFDERRN